MLNIRMDSRTLMFKFWLTVTVTLSLLSCGTYSKKNSYLEYISGGESFVLKKECVIQVSLPEDGYAKLDGDYIGIFVKIKNNAMCSGKFNDFFRNHIGNDLYFKFGGKYMMKQSRIVSEMKTEVGFYQGIFNKNYVGDILKAYN
ncbi:hypothetical protein [Klebsiella sp. BIGb0407]|uniref:hypothetical protein n=1 Tax=Klebsiella sp. BIGb0407 TaxID=2940603 RepID=UPI0021689304|nr:hypothetical protein [Klebsiella sp. BIGb0407]MCS3434105.1 hypothetical protein [Klebsiella sp. BIGb0407]